MSIASLFDIRPAGGFGLIMADPPWRFDLRSEKGEAKAPQAHYHCESTEDICRMPVEAVAARDCLLWLWACNPLLPDAFEVIRRWGFTFKTAGTWVKRSKHGRLTMGTGYVLRSANEPFLIATRGAPRTTRATRSVVVSGAEIEPDCPLQRSVITIEAAVREHSRKPDEAFKACEALMPGARRLELFSRQCREGWAVWGNEVGKFAGAAR
ncbi:MT-A70 family methyltransferase [Marinovum sp. SP66]|uniref:MT-A70 family methyltransferase n=1 Tax=Marinovum TaxID=367771 RepID=UPI00237C447A|nr:MT-A70 family methyltransferase [Marinovum sp. SP66]MDD9738444.1 MT-A70 family methyltransferase [Marinovum sp. SP66]